MVTTLRSRQVTRAALVALYEAKDSWKLVFGWKPTNKEIDGQSPFLIIEGVGSLTDMQSVVMNPTDFTFVCTSFATTTDNATLTPESAANRVDALDQAFRQVVRDNVQFDGGSAVIRFTPSDSLVSNISLHNKIYLAEMHIIKINYPSGGV